MWILFACLSAVFAALMAILAKVGVKNTDSNVATAVRTIVVLAFSWLMVFITGAQAGLRDIDGKSLIFLALSGLATGLSWLCYFRALQLGDVNKVTPIDKSSSILTVLFAMLLFNETDVLWAKLVGVALIAVGTYLMIDFKKQTGGAKSRAWLIYAVLSAVFAASTSLLAKVGVENVDSNLATALRTAVVLVMAWVVVAFTGKLGDARKIKRRDLLFICLSGAATGASWLCYYRAIRDGQLSVVVPIDKLSILITIAFAYFVFKEKLNKKSAIGLTLLTAGTLIMAIFK